MSPDEIDAFRGGDRSVFRRLVERHSPRLLAAALAYTRDHDQAHDAVQEVWLRAYERREQLASGESALGWLLTICRNVCHSEARRSAARSRDVSHVPGVTPAGEPPPDVPAERAELRAAVADAVARLPARQRDTVVLRILQGLSTRETAELMGCAEGTVKASLHHALENLTPILRSWRDVVVS